MSYSFFASEEAISPWDVVRQFAPPQSVVCVEDMKDISSVYGKVARRGEGRGGEGRVRGMDGARWGLKKRQRKECVQCILVCWFKVPGEVFVCCCLC